MHRWLMLFWSVGVAFFFSVDSFVDRGSVLATTPKKSHSQPGVAAVQLRKAPLVQIPGKVDCNSPAHWDGNQFFIFSSMLEPQRSSGTDLFHLGTPTATPYDNKINGGRWIEATYRDDDGTLYGWYHNEPHPVCMAKPELTAPRIGAVKSRDNGASWQDLGLILEAPPDSLYCETANKFFAGGNGDFSVIVDQKRDHIYFFFSTYHKNVAEQGIAVARMPYDDRDSPVGKVVKWHAGQWKEPGIGGLVSPIFPVTVDWNQKSADTSWGPSIHWNTYLNLYTLLLNRAIDGDWKQEGIYVSFDSNLDEPTGWSKPKKILDAKEISTVPKMGAGWYPQVIGTDAAKYETDKLAGRKARLFVHGKSVWEIIFLRPGEK